MDASDNGAILTNRPDYVQGYNGLELSLTRRLSHKWMTRAAFAYMDLHENFLGPAGIQNPTHQVTDPLINGGQVVLPGEVNAYPSARWQMSADALYQLPHGFEAAIAFWARQGYLNPYFLRLGAGNDPTLRALVSKSVEDNRLTNVSDLDMRLAKTVKLRGDSALVLSAEMFNLLNSGTVLGSNAQANSQVFGQIQAILNPRIVRFGARLAF